MLSRNSWFGGNLILGRLWVCLAFSFGISLSFKIIISLNRHLASWRRVLGLITGSCQCRAGRQWCGLRELGPCHPGGDLLTLLAPSFSAGLALATTGIPGVNRSSFSVSQKQKEHLPIFIKAPKGYIKERMALQ